jgi:circadian clock protein KaiB
MKPESGAQPTPFNEQAEGDGHEHHDFLLLVSGTTSRSARAIVNARSFCESHLRGAYQLEVVDISLRPEVAKAEQIIAAPTLVRARPLPRRLLIGDLSNPEKMRRALGLAAPGADIAGDA